MRLRRPCEHGLYVQHGGYDDDGNIWEPCPGGEFLAEDALEAEWRAGYAAAIVAFDAPTWWCMEHNTELRWLQSKQCWEASVAVQDNPCRLVQMRLVALADQVGEAG